MFDIRMIFLYKQHRLSDILKCVPLLSGIQILICYIVASSLCRIQPTLQCY